MMIAALSSVILGNNHSILAELVCTNMYVENGGLLISKLHFDN